MNLKTSTVRVQQEITVLELFILHFVSQHDTGMQNDQIINCTMYELAHRANSQAQHKLEMQIIS